MTDSVIAFPIEHDYLNLLVSHDPELEIRLELLENGSVERWLDISLATDGPDYWVPAPDRIVGAVVVLVVDAPADADAVAHPVAEVGIARHADDDRLVGFPAPALLTDGGQSEPFFPMIFDGSR